MQLPYTHNVVVEENKFGMIVCNTAIKRNGKTLAWSDTASQDAKDVADMMRKVLGISDITIVMDRSKTDIIDSYNELQAKVEQFANTKEQKQPLLVHLV